MASGQGNRSNNRRVPWRDNRSASIDSDEPASRAGTRTYAQVVETPITPSRVQRLRRSTISQPLPEGGDAIQWPTLSRQSSTHSIASGRSSASAASLQDIADNFSSCGSKRSSATNSQRSGSCRSSLAQEASSSPADWSWISNCHCPVAFVIVTMASLEQVMRLVISDDLSSFEELVAKIDSKISSSPYETMSTQAEEVRDALMSLWGIRQRIVRPPNLPRTGANSTPEILESMRFVSTDEQDQFIEAFTYLVQGSPLFNMLKEFEMTDMDLTGLRADLMTYVRTYRENSPKKEDIQQHMKDLEQYYQLIIETKDDEILRLVTENRNLSTTLDNVIRLREDARNRRGL